MHVCKLERINVSNWFLRDKSAYTKNTANRKNVFCRKLNVIVQLKAYVFMPQDKNNVIPWLQKIPPHPC